MILALTSDIYNRGQLYAAASTIIQQKLQIEDVGSVILAAEVNPERKAFYQLCWHLGGSQGDMHGWWVRLWIGRTAR